MGRSGAREEALFRTHRASFNAPEWAVGEVVRHEGALYRVTRWEDLPLIHLKRGGSTGEWRVWGVKLTDDEVRQGLIDAAERILG